MAKKMRKIKLVRQLPVIVSELCPHFMRVPRGYRRNGVSPMKGIDTQGLFSLSFLIRCRRNGASPIKGIIWQHICAAFFLWRYFFRYDKIK